VIDKEDILKVFDNLNKKYFQNLLYRPIFDWETFSTDEIYASFDSFGRRIIFNRTCGKLNNEVILIEVLLHEMVHINLYEKYNDKKDHTDEFWQELKILYDKEFHGNGEKLIEMQKKLCRNWA